MSGTSRRVRRRDGFHRERKTKKKNSIRHAICFSPADTKNFAGHLSRFSASLGVSSPGFGRGDRRDPYLRRVRRAGVLRDGEDGEVEAARFRGDDRLDGAVGIPGVQRERLRGEKRWGVSEHSHHSLRVAKRRGSAMGRPARAEGRSGGTAAGCASRGESRKTYHRGLAVEPLKVEPPQAHVR